MLGYAIKLPIIGRYFPGELPLDLAAARLRHIAGTAGLNNTLFEHRDAEGLKRISIIFSIACMSSACRQWIVATA